MRKRCGMGALLRADTVETPAYQCCSTGRQYFASTGAEATAEPCNVATPRL